MGAIFKKTYTMPAPPGIEMIERDGKRLARWRLRNGELRTAEIVACRDGRVRVRGRSKFYMVRYRHADGRVVEVQTRCRDEVAARAVLARHERRAELVRAGVVTPGEFEAADSADEPIAGQFDAYERHLRAKGGDRRRIAMVRRRLNRLANACGGGKLSTFDAARAENWLVEQADAGMAATTRNVYRESLVCFGNWCRRTRRLPHNPFADLPRADTRTDRRHQRRALTEAELVRLLRVALLRPLAEYGRRTESVHSSAQQPSKSRATWKRLPLTYSDLDGAVERATAALKDNPALLESLALQGRIRFLTYKTLTLTGLRRNELATLTVGQLDLTARVPVAMLNPADEKNRRGSTIPIRADLAAELRSWLDDRLRELQSECRRLQRPIPAQLPANVLLLRVPTGLNRIFDRDLAAAGIPKRDERNRVVDVHALRVTFGTHLAVAGVPLRTAQAAMRHSKPELTANIYTDPLLLDVAGAIAGLPSLQDAVPRPANAAAR